MIHFWDVHTGECLQSTNTKSQVRGRGHLRPTSTHTLLGIIYYVVQRASRIDYITRSSSSSVDNMEVSYYDQNC